MSEDELDTSSAEKSAWDFPGWGQAEKIDDLPTAAKTITDLGPAPKEKLGVWRATAICGNDITSSVLYVSALCAAHAGVLAPVVLLIVGVVLYLYRAVYAEVGSALPLNGGTYTALLNTTNKKMAAGAACLTLLSYIATAVISASEATHYAHHLFGGLQIIPMTIGILALFAALNVLGITESSVIALGIFVIHMITLTVLAVTGTVAVIANPSLLQANWSLPSPEGLLHALFFGFSAAMLGISGFESSANFIEEQQPGVFPKTLRNMWVAIMVFNPLISLISIGLLPLARIQEVPPDMLAEMGTIALGPTFGNLVSLDAVLVLSGAVLTSYVGVLGLVRRMSLDRCLPQFFLRQNRWRKTNHWIIVSFFGLCSSILLITKGNITTLAGVYTLSFLSVMALFAIGNMLLKHKRARLPRTTRAGWPTVVIALIAVTLGFIGNVLLDPYNVAVFAIYFTLVWCLIAVMFLRIDIMRFILFVSHGIVERVQGSNEWLNARVMQKVHEINSMAVVYFTRGDNSANLNRAALYVLENEQTQNMKVIHVYSEEKEMPMFLPEQLQVIDELYPQLKIDFIAVKGTFGAPLIEHLSQRLKVPKNMMFIGAPSDKFPHRIDSLGGVRVIMS